MTTRPSDDHAAREAEIRQRIAEEVREVTDEWEPNLDMFDDESYGRYEGMMDALRIIERGGAQPEGERT